MSATRAGAIFVFVMNICNEFKPNHISETSQKQSSY